MWFGLAFERGPENLGLLPRCGIANDTCITQIPLVSAKILYPATGAVSRYSESGKYCDVRRDVLFRGEVLGRTSCINRMAYSHGSARDHDAWSAVEHPKWGYGKILRIL